MESDTAATVRSGTDRRSRFFEDGDGDDRPRRSPVAGHHQRARAPTIRATPRWRGDGPSADAVTLPRAGGSAVSAAAAAGASPSRCFDRRENEKPRGAASGRSAGCPAESRGRSQLPDAVRQPAIEVNVRLLAPEMRAQLLASDDVAGPGEQQRRARGLRLERHGPIGSCQSAARSSNAKIPKR